MLPMSQFQSVTQVQPTPVPPENIFDTHIKKTKEIIIGNKGMIQLHFAQELEAKSLLEVLKRYPLLLSLNINKCNIVNTSKSHVLRLTKAQYEVLGLGSYEQLMVKIAEKKEVEKKLAEKKEAEEKEKDFINNYFDTFLTQLNGASFSTWLSSQSEVHVATILSKEDHAGKTILQLVAEKGDEAFALLLKKITCQDLVKVFSVYHINKVNVFMRVALHYDEESFFNLINQISSISYIKSTINGNSSMVLTCLLTCQSEQVFLKLYQNILDESDFKENKDYQKTFYNSIVKNASPFIWQKTFENLDAEFLVIMLNFAATNKETIFQASVRYQDEISLLMLIDKLDKSTLIKLLLMTNENRETSFQTIMRNHTPLVFQKIINILDNSLLNELIGKLSDVLFNSLYSILETKVFINLLQRLKSEIIQKKIKDEINITQSWLFWLSKKPEFWMNHLNVAVKIAESIPVDKLNHFLVAFIIKAQVNVKKNCSETYINQLLKEHAIYFEPDLQMMLVKLSDELHGFFLNNDVFLQLLSNEYFIFLALLPFCKLSTELDRRLLDYQKSFLELSNHVFYNGKGELISVNDQHLFDKILQDGVCTFNDYFKLQASSNPSLLLLLDKLLTTNCLFIGNASLSINQLADDVLRVMAQEKILIKVNSKERWNIFINMLKNTHGKPLRYECKNATHKFFHLRGETSTVVSKIKIDKNLSYTKKNSFTYLSPDFCTPLFGEHDPSRLIVGIAYLRKECDIKAMLKKDHGTYWHGWKGAFLNVKKYAKSMTNINMKNEDEFLSFIKNSTMLNEVLVKLKTKGEGAIAIVIARDTRDARKIARERVRDFEAEFKLKLPIVFYSSMQKKITLYDAVTQASDEINERLKLDFFHLHHEAMAKKKLLSLKESISSKVQPRTGLFGSQFQATYECHLSLQHDSILKEISAAEAAEKNHYPDMEVCFMAAEKKVRELLTSHQKSAGLQKEDSDFYHELLRKNFSVV